MKKDAFDRRAFLKGAVAGSAAAVTVSMPRSSEAQQAVPAPASASTAVASTGPTYTWLNPEEAAFIEVVVDHMIPADEHSPRGTDLGLNIYIDRALSGGWGKGERLYMQGPWKPGVPSQGYQLPLTPAALYRAGIEATNAHCRKTYGKTFERLSEPQREEVLLGLSGAKITFDSGLPVRVFWATVYQTVIEGMF